MNEVLLTKLQELKTLLDNDERIISLNLLDNEINNSDEVASLAYQKDMATLAYEDALKHFGKDSDEANMAQKKLYEAKYNLDEHHLVKKYNKAYKEVFLLYEKVNSTLFYEFTRKH